ncbi:MAG: hypothetical protein NT049_00810 [Planctomycetota bacterium]|nr:hypothetical protein [Planctomycetota bacterium]
MARGYPMERSSYSRDALETDEDLAGLFEVLDRVRDSRGRPACVTANMIMANPDFERIRAAGFREYSFEPAGDTLARSTERRKVPQLWAEGLARRLFIPQLHAREHVRWWEWLEALRAGSREALETFELGMCGVPMGASKEGQSFFKPPYLDGGKLSLAGVDLEALIRDAARLFRQQFGFRSLSTIAPNYCWTDSVERIWADEGIRFVQGAVFQVVDLPDETWRRPHYCGERGPAGLGYLVRNCFRYRDAPRQLRGVHFGGEPARRVEFLGASPRICHAQVARHAVPEFAGVGVSDGARRRRSGVPWGISDCWSPPGRRG